MQYCLQSTINMQQCTTSRLHYSLECNDCIPRKSMV